jgi:hypothetical protein
VAPSVPAGGGLCPAIAGASRTTDRKTGQGPGTQRATARKNLTTARKSLATVRENLATATKNLAMTTRKKECLTVQNRGTTRSTKTDLGKARLMEP